MSEETTENSETLLAGEQQQGEDTPVTTDETTSEDTGGESGGDDQSSPESYSDFTLPEGMELDANVMEQAGPLFKELGLDQAGAQKAVDFYANLVQEGVRSQTDQASQMRNDWVDQSKTDKEFGGDNFEQSISVAQTAINKFGTPELKQLLETTGVGNHPEVIRLMWNVGKLIQEDIPGGNAGSPTEKKDRVSIMYPTEK